jgi:ABC-2 type transport system ATP-binding protein
MDADAALAGAHLRRSFQVKEARHPVVALDDVSIRVAAGSLTALVGPDGAGKTTLLRLAAGLLAPDAGTLTVLGIDVARDPQAVQDRISYMPQRFGLYEDLSVQENLDLYADLHGVPRDERGARYAQLLEMTDLGRFTARLAGQLSGGMKQKLGLACTLVRSPELLLLDEPTVGVDPLSRRELWQIVQRLVEVERLTVLISTSYLDEAERCAQVYLLRQGRVLAAGTPAALRRPAEGRCFVATPPAGRPARALQARLLDDALEVFDAVPQAGEVRFIRRDADGAPQALAALDGAPVRPAQARLEDGFMVLLHESAPQDAVAPPATTAAVPADPGGDDTVIQVQDLVRKFGDFVAVAHTSFSVRRGEVFGLLGPNGAGKTTTFRMLCGLLPATSGRLSVAGVDLRTARAAARRRVGYVAQKFALYGNLNVVENLQFFAGAYGVRGARAAARVREVIEQFDLGALRHTPSAQLPGGYRQRLAMAAALLHEPQILFLDEPTSGADPLARREFWRRITALAEAGTTAVVTTHFMEEAEYCDRIVIQDAGKVLALGTPQEVRQRAGAAASMEEAFIGIVERARAAGEGAAA